MGLSKIVVFVDQVVLDVISGTSIGMWNVSSSSLERGKKDRILQVSRFIDS